MSNDTVVSLAAPVPGEGPPRWAAAVAEAPGRAVLSDEAGQLRSGQPAHLAQKRRTTPLSALPSCQYPNRRSVWATNS